MTAKPSRSLTIADPHSGTVSVTYELPALIERLGAQGIKRTLEFFGARIRNANTRTAYMKALGSFFAFLDDNGIEDLADCEPLTVASYLEQMEADGRSVATQKQHMAAIRMFLDYLVTDGILPSNVALSVHAPRHVVTVGKTPILDAAEAGKLLAKIGSKDLVALRDRALIAVMLFSFARISAAVGLACDDVFIQSKRHWLRLKEKGGKPHVMPCHHTLDAFLLEYMEAAGLTIADKAPLFRTVDRATGLLSAKRFDRVQAYQMVQRRAKAAGIKTDVCNHSFRGTGITTYLLNSGTLEQARYMAGHASMRTTQLYDRRAQRATLDHVERIIVAVDDE